jgi:DNA-binding SARP family transcriptional activator
MLSVRLFGPGQASYGERPFAGFPLQQPYLVLCYLLLNRRHEVVREGLATLFWPDQTRELSLKALRNALWRLRHMLRSAGVPDGQFLAVEDDRIAFAATTEYTLDTEVFERVIQRSKGRPGKSLTADQAHELEQATALYQGDLLEGVYSDWCLVDRERLRTLYMQALCTLMAYHEAQANYDCGLSYGEAILARDPCSETVHRRMMRLYWLSGDRGAAIAQYHRCVSILHDELGVGPMSQTQRLYHLLTRERTAPPDAGEGERPRHDQRSRAVDPSSKMIEDTLERIRRLQSVIVKTTAELERLERALIDMKH